MSAGSAVNSKSAFWFATYQGGLSGELFVTLLRKSMFNRRKAVHLVVNGLPAHKKSHLQGIHRQHARKVGFALPAQLQLRAGPQSG
jgi:hypothetical protein